MLTYANQLTILRMIFIPFFVLLLIYGYPKVAVVLFFLAGITDALDGFLARKLRQKTVLGSFLDPMADKLLITSAFITLTIPSVPVAVHLPAWLTITAFSRDLLIALAALVIHLQTGHRDFPPSMPGKCTTAAQLAAIGMALLVNLVPSLRPAFAPLVYAAFFMTVSSGLHYFYIAVKLIESYQKVDSGNGKERGSHP